MTRHPLAIMGLLWLTAGLLTGCGPGVLSDEPPADCPTCSYGSRIFRATNYDAAGAVTDYTTITYDAVGDRQRVVVYSTAGADGLWATADDGILNYTEYTPDPNFNNATRMVYAIGPGVDGVWFTGDDVLTYNLNQRDGAGRTILSGNFTGPGADGIWFTPDDVLGYLNSNQFDAAGRTTMYRTHLGPGADKVWLTADDPGTITEYTYNPAGITTLYGYFDSGVDQVWKTGDDTGYYYIYQYNGANKIIQSDYYIQPGADNTWHTADDVLSSRSVNTYTGGLLTLTGYINAGPDGVVNTADDSGSSDTFTYNANGAKTGDTYHIGAGADGVWFNGDDPISSYWSTMDVATTTNQVDANGNPTRLILY
ncbi:MAG: hypothetical protein OEW12_07200, partial [Deltaproteobacteria bacterium]|nr:hypothetical protein [Deltaproteobacteria bacterium]